MRNPPVSSRMKDLWSITNEVFCSCPAMWIRLSLSTSRLMSSSSFASYSDGSSTSSPSCWVEVGSNYGRIDKANCWFSSHHSINSRCARAPVSIRYCMGSGGGPRSLTHMVMQCTCTSHQGITYHLVWDYHNRQNSLDSTVMPLKPPLSLKAPVHLIKVAFIWSGYFDRMFIVIINVALIINITFWERVFWQDVHFVIIKVIKVAFIRSKDIQ